jgi:hypothetical protein
MAKTLTNELNKHKNLIKDNYEDLRNKILLIEQDALEYKINNRNHSETNKHKQNINDNL